MNKQEKELLNRAKEFKKTKSHEQFCSWLKGFRMVGKESDELKQQLEKLLDVCDRSD